MSRMKLRLIFFGIVLLIFGVNALMDRFDGSGDPQIDATTGDPQGQVVDITPSAEPPAPSPQQASDIAKWNKGVLKGPDEVALVKHIVEHGTLPERFITKSEARDRGWVASEGNLRQVAPGKSIGGDRFMNREKQLPDAPGRQYYEADLNYDGGTRGAERLVYSSDGLIFVTRDHYRSFEEVQTHP